ncbi:MAG: hypothetical protein O6942_00210 [Bacteroidetes bacterium]|nr:hypothetical protein [Bacteroidota bacterium]
MGVTSNLIPGLASRGIETQVGITGINAFWNGLTIPRELYYVDYGDTESSVLAEISS